MFKKSAAKIMRISICFVITLPANCALSVRAAKAFYRQSILSVVALEKKPTRIDCFGAYYVHTKMFRYNRPMRTLEKN